MTCEYCTQPGTTQPSARRWRVHRVTVLTIAVIQHTTHEPTAFQDVFVEQYVVTVSGEEYEGVTWVPLIG